MDRRRTALNVIEVREPCHADWNEMAGDQRARFCGHCSKTVHNLSAMPTDEAERLVCESAGRLCIRYLPAPDGTPMTLDYRPPDRRRGWRYWTMMGLGGTLVCLVINALTGRPPFQQPTYVVGTMVPRPMTQPAVMGGCPAPPVQPAAQPQDAQVSDGIPE